MPVKFYDYLAAGIAIISSLEREAKDIIESENIGIIYEPGNLDSLVRAINSYLGNSDGLSLARANSAKVSGQFDSVLQHENFSIFLENV